MVSKVEVILLKALCDAVCKNEVNVWFLGILLLTVMEAQFASWI